MKMLSAVLRMSLAAAICCASATVFAAEKAKPKAKAAPAKEKAPAPKPEPAPAAEAAPAEAPAKAEAAPAAAEDNGMSGYGKMNIEHVGMMEGSLDGRINKMSGGVKIKLLAGKPDQQDLPIKAETMVFSYAEGASKPSRIVLEGGVEINHPQAKVNADKADWNMEKNEIVFTGNPIMHSDRVKEMRGSKMTLNFDTNAFQVTDARIPEIDTNQPDSGAPGAPKAGATQALRESDVTDWAGLINALKTAVADAAASPGKQLATKGGDKMLSALKSVPTEELLKNKGAVLKGINAVLSKPGFYSKDAFANAAISNEVQALLSNDQKTAEETTKMNLLLLQAAYPNFIAPK